MNLFSVKQKMLVAHALNRVVMGSRRLLGLGPHVTSRRGGVSWALDLDEGIDLSIYMLGAYEPRILSAYTPLLKPGDVVLDIGANLGAHTLHFARLVAPSGRVHAFEPTVYAFQKLRRNLELNPSLAPVVVPCQAFLAAKPAEGVPAGVYSSWPVRQADYAVDPVHMGRTMPTTGAESMTGDAYCSAHNLTRIDLIKIDVDGHELSVLQGLRVSLLRFRPRLLIELAPFVFDQQSPGAFDEVVAFLAGLGYEFRHARHGGRLPGTAAGFRRLLPEGGSMNVLALPARD